MQFYKLESVYYTSVTEKSMNIGVGSGGVAQSLAELQEVPNGTLEWVNIHKKESLLPIQTKIHTVCVCFWHYLYLFALTNSSRSMLLIFCSLLGFLTWNHPIFYF